MNSEHTMQMPSGPPPTSQRTTCGEFSGEMESYGAAGSLGYASIPTSSGSSYASFGTGTPALPLLMSAPPSTSTFKTTTITMPASAAVPLSTPAPASHMPMSIPMPMSMPMSSAVQQAPPSMLPMSMSMSLATTPTTLPTQLLPMPTLEDIEVATQQPQTQPPQQPQQPPPPPQQQQPQQIQQQQQPPAPAGILKYPTPASVGYVSELLPPPVVASSANSGINSNCGTLKSNAKLLPLQLVATTAPARKEPPLPPTSTGSASQSQQRQRQRRQGWCACFGSGPSPSEGKTPPGYATKSKKRQPTAQTVWSALLTNLGICMLLLAYTLLGKYRTIVA
ncbi:hypothetical protein KR093_007993, partial [Drosophila rubida]